MSGWIASQTYLSSAAIAC